MNDCEEILKKANETQENAAKVIMEVQKMKEAVAQQDGKKIDDSDNIIMIPYSALEMEADRHDAEKDKMRKHYKAIIMWVSIALVTFMLLVFGSIWYILSSYEFSEFSQDVETGNANYVTDSGDVINGETNYPHNAPKVSQAERDSSK